MVNYAEPPPSLHASDASAPLRAINESFLELLIDMAHLPGEPCSDFISTLRTQIGSLTQAPRAIALRTPVLLVDIEFRNPIWWKAVAATPSRLHAPTSVWLAPPPRARAVKLARAALTLAWHLARTDLESSLVLMGLTAPVIEIVGALQPQQLDRIAELQSAHLRPRWEDGPSVWRQLLLGASIDSHQSRAFALRTLQLTWASARAPL